MWRNETKLIRQQAAEWLARRQASPLAPNEERAFTAWREADVRHAETFSQMESAWLAFDTLAQDPRSRLAPVDPDLFAANRALSGGLRPLLLSAAAGLAVAAAAWWGHRFLSRPAGESYASADALRGVGLPDGSEVELNVRTGIVQDFAPKDRRIRLLRGEAQFSVAKDPARPFVVEAQGVAFQALGTAFDIRCGTDEVDLYVTEGTVSVAHLAPWWKPGTAPIGILVEGQHLTISTGPGSKESRPAVESLMAADLGQVLSWQMTSLTLDDTPLSEVVDRLNRLPIHPRDIRRLVLGDSNVGSVRVSGRIRPGDVASFLEVLVEKFGVSAQRLPGGVVVLTEPGSAAR